MAPAARSRMTGSTWRQNRKVPPACTVIIRFQRSSDHSSTGPNSAWPAALNRQSIDPKCCATWSTQRPTAFSPSRSTTATCPPSAVNRCPTAAPSPDAPPVTSRTFPSNRIAYLLLVTSRRWLRQRCLPPARLLSITLVHKLCSAADDCIGGHHLLFDRDPVAQQLSCLRDEIRCPGFLRCRQCLGEGLPGPLIAVDDIAEVQAYRWAR